MPYTPTTRGVLGEYRHRASVALMHRVVEEGRGREGVIERQRIDRMSINVSSTQLISLQAAWSQHWPLDNSRYVNSAIYCRAETRVIVKQFSVRNNHLILILIHVCAVSAV